MRREIKSIDDFTQEEKDYLQKKNITNEHILWIKENLKMESWKKVDHMHDEHNLPYYKDDISSYRIGFSTTIVYIHKMEDKCYVGQCHEFSLQGRWKGGSGYEFQRKAKQMLKNGGVFKDNVEHYIVKVPAMYGNALELYLIATLDSISNGFNKKFMI